MKKGISVGTAVLQAAQDAVGLSNERLAREIPVSERTWRRWKEIGEVPVYYLPKVATILNLEIERPPTRRVMVDEEAVTLERVAEELAETRATVDRILQLTLQLLEHGAGPSRAASG